MYYGERAHCLVPRSFVVPSTGPYPREAWGLALGITVNHIRQGIYATQIARDADRLKVIDFAWSGVQGRWDLIILPALETFFQIRGHSRVVVSFIVPSEAPWPKSTWGLKLGRTYDGMKRGGYYAAQRRQDRARLEAIEFPIKCDDEEKSPIKND